MGNDILNFWHNGAGSLPGGDGFNMPNCRSTIPLDRIICPSEDPSFHDLDARQVLIHTSASQLDLLIGVLNRMDHSFCVASSCHQHLLPGSRAISSPGYCEPPELYPGTMAWDFDYVGSDDCHLRCECLRY
jgi:hypothetical protein